MPHAPVWPACPLQPSPAPRSPASQLDSAPRLRLRLHPPLDDVENGGALAGARWAVDDVETGAQALHRGALARIDRHVCTHGGSRGQGGAA